MRVNQLKEVAEKENAFNVTDFKYITEGFSNVKISKSGLLPTNGVKKMVEFTDPERPIKIASTKNRPFVLCSSGYLYECLSDNTLNFIAQSDSDNFAVAEVLHRGEQKVFVHFSNGDNYLIAPDCSVTLFNLEFFTNVLAYSCGKLYFGVGRKIIFSETFDIEEQIANSVKKFIELPVEVGEILSIIPKEKKLLIFTERAVFRLSPLGTDADYTVERLLTLKGRAKKDTVKQIGEEIYFVCGSNLYKYLDGNISTIQTTVNFGEEQTLSSAARIDGKYLIIVNASEKNGRVYAIDTEDFTEQIYDVSAAHIADGGYIAKNDGVYEFVDGTSSNNFRWTSKFLDFGSINKKTVKKIYFESDEKVTVTITGEYFSKSFTSNGVFQSTVNLSFNKLRITVVGDKGCSVKNLKIIYTKKGE